MSDIGTITEIEPEDGLGWIELKNGDRVRFGGTSCKGFVPAVGMQVKVVATRPGYGGTVKATSLERIADAPKSFAQAPGAVSRPRTSLHTVQSAGIAVEDLLLTILGRADVDDTLHDALESAGFVIAAEPGLKHGCRNPFFYRIAKDGRGNAYGVYVHPMFDAEPPWLLWTQASGHLRFIGNDTADFFAALLASAQQSGLGGDTLALLRRDLAKLGVPEEPGQPHAGGTKVDWLPPDDADLRPLADYLGESDGGVMERGLLAHAFANNDAKALEALRSLYEAWGWGLPAWA